jgi:hypothetical protein
MIGIGKKGKAPAKQTDDTAKPPARPPPPASPDDEYEDGDIATPKHDRHGTDDEPL